MILSDFPREIEKDKQSDNEDIDLNIPRKENKKASLTKIKGVCDEFISRDEKKAREPCDYEIPSEKYPKWQPLACHYRNIEYTSQNLRNLETLSACLDFICSEYLPYYKTFFADEKERKKFEFFLYDRVKSIRCELFVQSEFEPKLALKLMKIMLFMETIAEFKVHIAGLQYFFTQEAKMKFLQDENLRVYYDEALKYAIYWYDKKSLIELLDQNSEEIFENPHLHACLKKRMKILSNNYLTYLMELSSNEDIYVRLILWSQIAQMRELIICRYKCARMNERAGFLCKVLGYAKMEGWIDISKEGDMKRLEQNKSEFDLEIKMWISSKSLLEELDRLIND